MLFADITGSLSASITLAEQLREFVSRYARAPDDYDSSLLFGGELLEVSLRQIISALDHWKRLRPSDTSDLSKVKEAADKLKKNLLKAGEHLQAGAPEGVLRRIRWSLWAGTDVESAFEDIRKNLNTISNIVKLAAEAPNVEDLCNDDFRILESPERELVLNSATGYKASAEWYPRNASRRLYADHVDVFVESYNGFSTTRQALREPQQSPTSFPTGLLPCIGAQKHRVVWLLPSNIRSIKTLRQMYFESSSDPAAKVPSVETRYTIAAQAAEAVYKIYSAGLLHRAIRSDTLLYIEPQDDGSQAPARENPPRNEQEGMMPPAPRQGVVRRASSIISNIFQGAQETADHRGRNKRRADSVSKQKRPPSGTRADSSQGRGSRKFSFSRRRSPSGKRESAVPAEKKDEDETKKLEPTHHTRPAELPRLPRGNLYLIYWAARVDKFSRIGPIDDRWHSNIYYHPDQQGNRVGTEAYPPRNMGHDIYSLGVCLLEIGLWQAMVFQAWDAKATSKLLNGDAKAPKRKMHQRLFRRLEQENVGRETLKELLQTDRGRELVKTELVALASEELPQRMGEQYAELVKACLTCLDGRAGATDGGSIWKVDFTDTTNKARLEEDCEAYQAVVLKFLRSIVSAFEAESPFKTGWR